MPPPVTLATAIQTGQLTAEDLPLSDEHVAALRALAARGIARLVALQEQAIASL